MKKPISTIPECFINQANEIVQRIGGDEFDIEAIKIAVAFIEADKMTDIQEEVNRINGTLEFHHL